ncbi:MAG: acyl carrier protein [Chloroflexota bacterium]|nr:acyl carrier protein [Chloroflexota bacterium]
MDVDDRIRDFIMDQPRWRGSRRDLTRDRPLISDGILDSLGILEFVSFVEATFGVEVLDEELVPEHFGTIAALESFIAGKRTPGPRA